MEPAKLRVPEIIINIVFSFIISGVCVYISDKAHRNEYEFYVVWTWLLVTTAINFVILFGLNTDFKITSPRNKVTKYFTIAISWGVILIALSYLVYLY